MNAIVITFFVMATLLSGVARDYPVDPNAYRTELNVIVSALTNREVRRVEILYFPTNAFTRVRVTASWLEKNFHYKLTIRDAGTSIKMKDLSPVLEKLEPKLSKELPDLRWGIIFYSRDDVRLGSVFLDGSGAAGLIGNTAVDVQSTLHDWLLRTLSPCFM